MSLADNTLNTLLKEKHNLAYYDLAVQQMDLGDDRVNALNIPMFQFSASAIHPKEASTSYFDSHFHDAKAFRIASQTEVEMTHYHIGQFKTMKKENVFDDFIIAGKEIEPLHHKNPQWYQFYLYKNDIDTIALKRQELKDGYTNEYTKALAEFDELRENEEMMIGIVGEAMQVE